MSKLKPREVVAKWVKAFNEKDLEGIGSLYHENAVNYQVAELPIEGKKAIYEMFKREFLVAKMVCIVENLFEDGDWAILEWRDPLGLRGCGFFYIQNDKITLQRGYWDKLSFLRQHKLPLPKE